MEKRTGSSLATEVEGKDTVVKEVEKAEAVAAVVAAVAAAVAAAVTAEALAVHAEETVEVVEEVKDAKDRISMQQRVCYACGALLRREQTGTCSRTGIGQPA